MGKLVLERKFSGEVIWHPEAVETVRQWREKESLTAGKILDRLDHQCSPGSLRGILARHKIQMPGGVTLQEKNRAAAIAKKAKAVAESWRDPLRVSAGEEPLRAGHPLSWGVIATGTAFPWGEQ